MKICRTCAQEKPLSEFYKHVSMLDGHLNICRDCTRARVRRHRQLNDSVREYDRHRGNRQTKEERAAIYANTKEARRAHTLVQRAVQKEALQRRPCWFCGTTENLHAHHQDYSRPLDVTWLCAQCHRRLHALIDPKPQQVAP